MTALAVLAAMVLDLLVTATTPNVVFPTVGGRIFNLFTYFTIQSNLIVGGVCLLLALNLHRTSMVFRVFRLTGLVGIIITGVVYHLLLAQLRELTGHAAVADFLLHTLIPVLYVTGWLLFGPRRLTSPRAALLSMLYPVLWLAFTLIRGAALGYYPYPFINVGKLGYAAALRSVGVIAVFYLAIAFGATALDWWLARGMPLKISPRVATP